LLLEVVQTDFTPLGPGSLEADGDDRIPLEMSPVGSSCLPDVKILEQPRQVFAPPLEEGAEHRQVERLAEPPRPRQQQHLISGTIEHLDDEVRLVDVLEPESA